MALSDIPHLNFTRATTRFSLWNHVTHKFILALGEVTGICFTPDRSLDAVFFLFAAYTE